MSIDFKPKQGNNYSRLSVEEIEGKLAAALDDQNEFKFHEGLVTVRCKTFGKPFIRETYERLEIKPWFALIEIEEFINFRKP